MEPVWQWGLDVIRAVQLVHGPVLDAFFKAVTAMGSELFFLIFLPLVFWCVDFVVGARLAFAFLLSVYLNVGLKDLFAHPRPFELDPSVKLYDTGGYGLPSGHAQAAVVVWGIIADAFHRAWLWGVALLLMVLIGFSRVYLGVHFPSDVLGGWAVGAVFLVVYLALERRIERWLRQAGLVEQMVLAVIVPLVLLLFHPAVGAVRSMAVLMGMGVGMVFTKRVAPFSAAGPLWQRAVRFLLGMIILFALYVGLRAILPGTNEPLYVVMQTARYALVGLWMTLGAPWLFQRLLLVEGPEDNR